MRIDTKGEDMVIFDTIRYDTLRIIIVNIQTFTIFTSFYLWTQQRNAFTNTVARFTKELDKTNLFVKLKKQCTVQVLNKSVTKMTFVDFDSIKQLRTSVFTCIQAREGKTVKSTELLREGSRGPP